jgi:hypothetical protein
VIFRRRFRDVVARQLDLFAEERAGLLAEAEDAERAYDEAERDDAEEAYGDYLLVVEAGTEALADLRDTYARTLDEETAPEYERTFNRAAAKRFPRFAAELDDT